MKWRIPAKTFLVGEYLALKEGPAILLTTEPAFEVAWPAEPSCEFHQNSPAGKFCQRHHLSSIQWQDPYQGLGGLGASSAQFLGAFWIKNRLQQKQSTLEMLETYFDVAWNGEGEKPSGYDVIAQSLEQCVFINRKENIIYTSPWPFDDITFLLVHTGKKLATHTYLKENSINIPSLNLEKIVKMAWDAFDKKNSGVLIEAINDYYHVLLEAQLVAPHTLQLIEYLSSEIHPLAIKGCGAMGADVILVVIETFRAAKAVQQLQHLNYQVLASLEQLYCALKQE